MIFEIIIFGPFLEILMPKLPEYLTFFFNLKKSILNNSKGVKDSLSHYV